jgi:hypothetical protein
VGVIWLEFSKFQPVTTFSLSKRDLLKFVNWVMTLFSGHGAVLEWAATQVANAHEG